MGKQRRDHTIFVISCDLLSACVVEPCTCGEGSRLVRRMARLRRGIPRGRGIPRVGLRLLAACRSDGRHRGPVGDASGFVGGTRSQPAPPGQCGLAGYRCAQARRSLRRRATPPHPDASPPATRGADRQEPAASARPL